MSYTGFIKSFNGASGWGFIRCDETFEMYEKDIILLKKNKGDNHVNAGDEVSFNVQDGAKGPEAIDITIHSHCAFPPPNAKEKKAGWHVGNVKSYNTEKGWGFISCEATKKKYDKDIFLMHTREKGVKVNAGDRVRFTVKQGEKGPEADKVEAINENGEVIDQPFDEKPKHEGKGKGGKSIPARGKGKGVAATPAKRKRAASTDGSIYEGKIKSFNEKRGWGFIECEDTEAVYGKDIIVHHKNVGSRMYEPGERVRFAVIDGDKGPEAVDVEQIKNGRRKVSSEQSSTKKGDYGLLAKGGKGGKDKAKGKAKAMAMAAYEAAWWSAWNDPWAMGLW